MLTMIMSIPFVMYMPLPSTIYTGSLPISQCSDVVDIGVSGDGWRFTEPWIYAGSTKEDQQAVMRGLISELILEILQVEDVNITQLGAPYLIFDYWSDQGTTH